jgi:hypothetical protein
MVYFSSVSSDLPIAVSSSSNCLSGDHTCLSCNTGELEETQQDGTNEPQENTLAKAESPINSNANKPIPKPRNNLDNKPVPKPRKGYCILKYIIVRVVGLYHCRLYKFVLIV